MYEDIKVGYRVQFETPQGQKSSGKVVMKGTYGWVLNAGGRYGTPKVVTPKNFVKILSQ
jgi:hypothetical protein